jgi:hypothetical protein
LFETIKPLIIMAQNLNAGEQITLAEATKLTCDFRKTYSQAIKAHLISAANIQRILEQSGCTGLRIYNGFDEITGKITPVIVGTDVNNNDLYNGVIMDRTIPCPSCCDSSSPLSQ